VKIGVLSPTGRSEWIAGTFIIPKKLLPGETVPRVRWVSDFRGLNKCLRCKTYPIPRIGDILARRTGHKFLSKLDISMQFYTFELGRTSVSITNTFDARLFHYNSETGFELLDKQAVQGLTLGESHTLTIKTKVPGVQSFHVNGEEVAFLAEKQGRVGIVGAATARHVELRFSEYRVGCELQGTRSAEASAFSTVRPNLEEE